MRVYNFGAGPATLPTEILIQAQAEFLDWQQQGMSVVEVSHRSPAFMTLLNETIEILKDLLNVPDSYEVLLMGVPARFHFGSIPLNFLKCKADYVISGSWSKLAAAEANKVGDIHIAGSNEADNY
jgi:phosphoserine aminotransferase